MNVAVQVAVPVPQANTAFAVVVMVTTSEPTELANEYEFPAVTLMLEYSPLHPQVVTVCHAPVHVGVSDAYKP